LSAGTETETGTPPPQPPPERRKRISPDKGVLAVGAIAGALLAIITLGDTVVSWFKSDPAGSVERMQLQAAMPLTYGEWRQREGVPNRGVPPDQLRVPGRLITYEVDTEGFAEGTQLPVRIIVHDITRHSSRTIEGDVIRVTPEGDDCGCADWVAAARGGARYYIEVAIYPPGPVRGDPVKAITTRTLRR
jgi:hypothetical protein